MGWCGLHWSLAQDRDKWRVLVNVVMNLRIPQYAGKSGYTTSGLLGSPQFHRVSWFFVDLYWISSQR
jgi:hypothetical protein